MAPELSIVTRLAVPPPAPSPPNATAACNGLTHHTIRMITGSGNGTRSCRGHRAGIAAIATVTPLTAQDRDEVAAGTTTAADGLGQDARRISTGGQDGAVTLRDEID